MKVYELPAFFIWSMSGSVLNFLNLFPRDLVVSKPNQLFYLISPCVHHDVTQVGLATQQ